MIEAADAHHRFQFLQFRFREILRAGKALKKRRRHRIDFFVGALRGQNGRDQQFKGVPVVQTAFLRAVDAQKRIVNHGRTMPERIVFFLLV